MVIVYPKISADKIKLDDNIRLIRSLYENKYTSSEEDRLINDYYHDEQIHVIYKDEKAKFIGINLPLEVECNGINLSSMRYSQIRELFKNSKEKYGDYNSLIFIDLGIGFYFEDDDQDPRPLQVGVFLKEIYSDVMNTLKPIE